MCVDFAPHRCRYLHFFAKFQLVKLFDIFKFLQLFCQPLSMYRVLSMALIHHLHNQYATGKSYQLRIKNRINSRIYIVFSTILKQIIQSYRNVPKKQAYKKKKAS